MISTSGSTFSFGADSEPHRRVEGREEIEEVIDPSLNPEKVEPLEFGREPQAPSLEAELGGSGDETGENENPRVAKPSCILRGAGEAMFCGLARETSLNSSSSSSLSEARSCWARVRGLVG